MTGSCTIPVERLNDMRRKCYHWRCRVANICVAEQEVLIRTYRIKETGTSIFVEQSTLSGSPPAH